MQNTYNNCEWCDVFSGPVDAESFMVTPHLFEMHGFVEFYPQRWVLPRVRLLFDIIESEEDSENELRIEFVAPPSRRGIAFMTTAVEFLEKFEKAHIDRSDIPKHELEGIMSLHSATKIAFKLAIDQSEGQLSDEIWWEDEEDWFLLEDDEDEDPGDGFNPYAYRNDNQNIEL